MYPNLHYTIPTSLIIQIWHFQLQCVHTMAFAIFHYQYNHYISSINFTDSTEVMHVPLEFPRQQIEIDIGLLVQWASGMPNFIQLKYSFKSMILAANSGKSYRCHCSDYTML